jgi:hypothetical protein
VTAAAAIVRAQHIMTAPEAIEICRVKAGELNVPWRSDMAVARRRRVWPFPPFWRVVSRVPSDGLTVTMNVYERTREAKPIRALWATDKPEPVQLRLVLLLALKLMVSGGLIWLADRYLGRQPVWHATLIAIPGSIAGVIFYELLEARIRMAKYDDEEKDDDADIS